MAVVWKKLAYTTDVAALSDAAPASVGTAGAAGVGTAASRDDHVHDLGAGSVDASDIIAADVIDSVHYAAASIDTEHIAADQITSALIADDAVGSEHIEALSAALDFAGNQATDFVFQNNADNPVTPVLGKTYFKTGDTSVYVCTSIV